MGWRATKVSAQLVRAGLTARVMAVSMNVEVYTRESNLKRAEEARRIREMTFGNG